MKYTEKELECFQIQVLPKIRESAMDWSNQHKATGNPTWAQKLVSMTEDMIFQFLKSQKEA